eukprot:m.25343 g.25343  ORF g.25343 m.25343 type:complete len:556 (+) comp5755_c1_seq1:41-1708(+)
MSSRDIEIHRGETGYGFNLAKLGHFHFFRAVEEGGAADFAGANVGDRLLKVNGQDVTQVTHAQLVQLIKQAGQVLRLSVIAITQDEINQLQQQQQPQLQQLQQQPQQQSQQQQQQPNAMTIVLLKTAKGFGFNLSKAQNRHFFRVIQPQGAAEIAGAHPGDEIISVNGTSVIGMEHTAVVEMIKVSGDKVEMIIIPNMVQSQESLEAMSDRTMQKISEARARASGMLKSEQARLVEAEKLADEERDRLRQGSLQQAEKIRQQRIQEQFEHDKTMIENNLRDAMDELELAKKKVSSARGTAQEHATQAEFDSFHAMLSGIRKSELERLDAEHTGILPEDANDRAIEELRRKMQRAVVEQEIYDVQATEWNKFATDCHKRREEEKETDKDMFERTKVARDRDMEFLQKKKERMERLMKEAEEKRVREIEDVRGKEKEKREREAREMQLRAEKAAALAQRRQEELAHENMKEAQRERVEAERQATLAMQAKEEEMRLKKIREYNEKQESTLKERMGTPLNARRPEKRANPSHPMIALLQKSATGVKIPLIKGLQSTNM